MLWMVKCSKCDKNITNFYAQGVCKDCFNKAKKSFMTKGVWMAKRIKWIEKDGEKYIEKPCQDCGTIMKVSMGGRKYCINCKIKRQKEHSKTFSCPNCGFKIERNSK